MDNSTASTDRRASIPTQDLQLLQGSCTLHLTLSCLQQLQPAVTKWYDARMVECGCRTSMWKIAWHLSSASDSTVSSAENHMPSPQSCNIKAANPTKPPKLSKNTFSREPGSGETPREHTDKAASFASADPSARPWEERPAHLGDLSLRSFVWAGEYCP